MRDPLGNDVDLAVLADYVGDGDVMVLTGAGMSTDSGIPDYRGAGGSLRRYTPMTFQTFIADADSRRRYWARSHLGWRRFAAARPNPGHRMVARLQQLGFTSGIVTQNVDGLHQEGGAVDVIDLHGRLDRVICLSCRALTSRHDLDTRLRDANPQFDVDVTALNPDGDADVSDVALTAFNVVACECCGGVLKPDVVFFGESVPRPTVDRCFGLLDRSGMLLVLGSSLTVLSGYRFVRYAAKHGVPVVIVNQGVTRGDAEAALLVDAPLGLVLPGLVQLLEARRTGEVARSTLTGTA